jgi:hypothetical protein
MSSDVKIHTSPLQIIPSSSLDGSLNIFIGEVDKDNICIICLDSDNLIQNNKCSCIYYFHQSCMEQIENKNQCILCKKEIDIVQPSSMPNNQINLTIQIENSTSCCCSLFICMVLMIAIIVVIYNLIKCI